MKKNVIALLLAVVMASSNVGTVPALAAEDTTQAVAVEEEAVEGEKEESAEAEDAGTGEVSEEITETDSVEEIEEVPEQESAEESDTTEEVEEVGTTEEVEEVGTIEEEDVSEETVMSEETAESEKVETVEESAEEAGTTEEADVTEEDDTVVDTEEEDTAVHADTAAEMTEEEEIAVITEEGFIEVEANEAVLAEGDIVDSGTCGENAAWTLTGADDDLTLTISGSGAMIDYFEIAVPWESIKEKIKTIIVEDGITYLGDSAFSGCSSLTSVTIPDSVTEIGQFVFYGCSSLTSITMSDNLEWIGSAAFYGCSSITSITIPDSVQGIDALVFSGCSSLTDITIPENATSIESNTFKDCSSLTSITIPENVTSIEDGAFKGCSGLTSITIPDKVTRIMEYAFSGCSKLTSITIPGSVTRLWNYAFEDCSGLTSITIPDSITKIGEDVFCNCYFNRVYFRGTKEQWAAKWEGSIEYDSIFYNYFSVDADFQLSGTSFVYTGNTIEPAVTVSYNGHELVEGTDFELEYRNNINAGTASVEIKGIGDYSGVATEKFSIKAKSITNLTISGITSKTYTGKTQTQAVSVNDGDVTLTKGTDYTVSYKNNTNVGTASVVITGKGNYTGTVTKSFTICPKSVSSLTISGITAKTYTGKAQTQAVVVKDGTTTLVKGTDYTLAYKNNTNAGTASVVITGKGNYTGSVTKTFTIKKAANAVTAKNFVKTYSATAQTFALGATAKGGTLTYASSSSSVTITKAGKVTVKAKFIGKATITITAQNANYNKATKKITVTVNPTKTGIASVTSPAAGQMLVKWKKNAVGTGYQIQYSTSSKFTGAKSAWITKNTILNKKITNLTKGKKYYVRMRTYKTVGGVKYYSGWCTVKTVTIRK